MENIEISSTDVDANWPICHVYMTLLFIPNISMHHNHDKHFVFSFLIFFMRRTQVFCPGEKKTAMRPTASFEVLIL